jgi:hypothetical protein
MKWYSKMDTATSLSKDNLGKHTTYWHVSKETNGKFKNLRYEHYKAILYTAHAKMFLN